MNTSPRIALIESDDLIRQLATRWLISAGYQVTCVRAEALRGIEADLLLADISNPRLGASLARALGAVHAAPVMLVSARFHRTDGLSVELAAQLGVAAVLAKPYSKDELITAVDAVLHRPGDRSP